MWRMAWWRTPRWLWLMRVALLLSIQGCAQTPLATLPYTEPQLHNETLLVLLPGIWDSAKDFEAKGFVQKVQEQHLPADVLAVNASFGYYLNQTVTRRLKEDVIDPAKRHGYKRIWLVGISLGGLGSLLYTREYPEDVTGVVVFSPYLGRDSVINEIADAGGLRVWQPASPSDNDWERPFWEWLKQFSSDPAQPPIYVGYGSHDQFAKANALLAQALPQGHEVVVDGAHDWRTWEALWSQMLAREKQVLFPAATTSNVDYTAWDSHTPQQRRQP